MASEAIPHRAALRGELLHWFDRHQRALPWRRTRDPYAIWVSEVMLQQTQVTTVIPYWKRFLERFPTVDSLAAATSAEVLPLWKGLGYYSRARNLHRAAQQMVALHSGQVPSSVEQLLALPGFGRYTAGAVASIAFAQQAPLVDGNVARVFSRLFEVEGPPGDRQREARLWALAQALVVGEQPGALNQALMELGALICRADSPACLLCPVQKRCGALAAGRVDELPVRKVRAARKSLLLVAGVWQRGGEFLLARRPEQGLFGGLWELPCVELQGKIRAPGALRKAFGEKLKVRQELAEVSRTLTHRDLTVRLFSVEGEAPAPGERYLEVRWASPQQAVALGMSTAMRVALEAACAALPPRT